MGAGVSKAEVNAALRQFEDDLEDKFVTSDSLNGYATQQALTNYVTSESLSSQNYVTSEYLKDRNYVTQSEVSSNTLWCGANGDICETPAGKGMHVKGNLIVDGEVSFKDQFITSEDLNSRSFATQKNLSDHIVNAENTYVTSKFLKDQNYATQKNLSDHIVKAENTYVTSKFLTDQNYATQKNLSDHIVNAENTYVTSKFLKDQNYATQKNLSDHIVNAENTYVTSKFLNSQGYAKEGELPSKTLWCAANGTLCETPAGKRVNVKGDMVVDGTINFKNMLQFKGDPGNVSNAGVFYQTVPTDANARQQVHLISDSTGGPRFSWGTALNGKALSLYGHDASGQTELMQLRKEGHRMGTVFTQPMTTALPGNSHILRVADPSAEKARFLIETVDNGNVFQVATFDANGVFNGARPLQISASEKLVAFPNGVKIGDWRITPEGNSLNFIKGTQLVAGLDPGRDRLRVYADNGDYMYFNNVSELGTAKRSQAIFNNDKIGIQSSRSGWLTDGGGWGPAPVDNNSWETMYIRKTGF